MFYATVKILKCLTFIPRLVFMLRYFLWIKCFFCVKNMISFARTKLLFMRVSLRKYVVVLMCLSVFLFYGYFTHNNFSSMGYYHNSESDIASSVKLFHKDIVKSYFKARELWSTSNLGSILFKNVPKGTFNQHDRDNNYVVLIWKHWKWLQSRHVHGFNTSGEADPLSQCSVNNCIFTGNNSLLDTADAVVVHIQKGYFPKTENRNRQQRWIFLNDESPLNAFSMASRPPKLLQIANVFNWSMTYRSDADIPVPYGRTVALPKTLDNVDLTNLIPNWNKKRRDVLPTVLMSNCKVSYRMKYLKELKRHIDVDVHGKCSDNNKKSCPGHFKADCELMSQYLFYLVFENSKCKEYLTEKSFYHAYSKGAIPVFLGPPLEDCEKLLPPNSFLHVDNFETPQDLAEELVRIANDRDRLLSFHQWRSNFEVLNEHGYFGSRSFHLCRVCEALNYNDEKEKVYTENDLKEFLDPKKTCS